MPPWSVSVCRQSARQRGKHLAIPVVSGFTWHTYFVSKPATALGGYGMNHMMNWTEFAAQIACVSSVSPRAFLFRARMSTSSSLILRRRCRMLIERLLTVIPWIWFTWRCAFRRGNSCLHPLCLFLGGHNSGVPRRFDVERRCWTLVIVPSMKTTGRRKRWR